MRNKATRLKERKAVTSQMFHCNSETKDAGDNNLVCFNVQNNWFSISKNLLSNNGAMYSGLGNVINNQEFKDIPAGVARDNVITINSRDPDKFEVFLAQLKGEQPLKECDLNDFENKFEALVNEMDYWNMPIEKLNIPLKLWFDSAWTDGNCLYPFVNKMLMVEEGSPNFTHIVYLDETDILPINMEPYVDKNLAGITLSAYIGNRKNIFTIYFDKTKILISTSSTSPQLVQFGEFNITSYKLKQGNFRSFVILPCENRYLVVLTPGIFIYIDDSESCRRCVTYRREERWICVHPVTGLVISGVSPGVPYIECLDMEEETSMVKFFPWGGIAIFKKVTLESQGIMENDGVTSENRESQIESSLEHLISSNSIKADTRKQKCFAKLFRQCGNKNYQCNLFFLFCSDKPDSFKVMEHIKDFDLVDRKCHSGIYITYIVAQEALLMIKSSDTENSQLIMLNGKSAYSSASESSIKTGCPSGECMKSFYLFGEYHVNSGKYYSYSLGKLLIEIQSKIKANKSLAWDACSVQ